jgi:NADPH:quinone reductase-like Zn-dependent oxidoreductase
VKAALRDRYGTAEVVDLREVERPTPIDDQVLVQVHAASVNRADLDLLRPKPGFTRLFLGLRAPKARGVGLDVAGVVASVGPAATRFAPGDRVFADLYSFSYGAFAEYACASEKAFERIPDHLGFETAATLPHSATLAIQGLRRRNGRGIRPGDKVLIVGASGNVGPFAVQIAKGLGAEVTGICSTDKVEFVRSLGADHVIDYTTVDYTTTGERYDWILDTDSHQPVLRIRRALRSKGVYVTLGGSTRRLFAAMLLGPVISLATRKQLGLMLWWKPFHPPDVEALTDLIAEGTLTPRIDRRYPLSAVVEALEYVDDGRPSGKVIVTMDLER